ncbi:MAG: hypothetical protein A2167_07930 [Planctomycetes bacterium RBG_13_46_10]|nr:MAG: hypothetical protein A2167_07930 [Planctomycetes bacterium RBG_13_46_10]
MESRQVSLLANDAPIELNNFVEGYIDHVVSGILASLRGTGEIKSIDLTVEGDQVSIILNNAAVPINPFTTRIIRSTIVGMVSSLKEVRTIERIKVSIRR